MPEGKSADGKNEVTLNILELIGDREKHYELFQDRRKLYDQLLAKQAKEREDFFAKASSASLAFTDGLTTELNASRESLCEVAVFAPGDAGEAPILRAAYTDRMAALMAKLSLLAYVDFEDPGKKKILEDIVATGGLTLCAALAKDDTEAIVVESENFLAVAFRGTANENDLRTDLKIQLQPTRVPGHSRTVEVHSGFYAAFKHIGDDIHELLKRVSPHKPIYLTGHSLGGALALVAAADYSGDEELGHRIAAVYTFGAPRVGRANYTANVKAPHHRIVNEGDLVPLVPPTWRSGYRHSGDAVYLKRKQSVPVRTRDFGSAFFLALASVVVWIFTGNFVAARAHDIHRYVGRLDAIASRRGKWS